jgi:hypothetical protein
LRRYVIGLFVLAAIIVYSAAMVTLAVSGTSSYYVSNPHQTRPAAPVPAGQAVFAEKLKNDQESLDRGVLAHTTIAALKPGAQTTFTVIITDTGKQPHATPLLADFPGWVLDHQDVPTGGIISVTATCDDMKLKCEPESPARQAVLAASYSGNWTWALTALSPGPAHITLTVTTYDQNSQTVLNEAAPIEITTRVHDTTIYHIRALARTIAGLLRWIGPPLLVAGLAAIWARYRKRRTHTPENTPAYPTNGAPPTAGPNATNPSPRLPANSAAPPPRTAATPRHSTARPTTTDPNNRSDDSVTQPSSPGYPDNPPHGGG